MGTKEAENNDDNENLKTVSDGGVYDELMSACYKSRNPTGDKSHDEFESFLFSQFNSISGQREYKCEFNGGFSKGRRVKTLQVRKRSNHAAVAAGLQLPRSCALG